MRKILALLFWSVLFAIIFAQEAAAAIPECSGYKFLPDPNTLVEGEFHEIKFSAKVEDLNSTYDILGGGRMRWDRFERWDLEPIKSGPDKGWLPEQTITTEHLLRETPPDKPHTLHIQREGSDYCQPFEYTVSPKPSPTPRFANCRLQAISDPPDKFDSTSIITIKGSGVPPLLPASDYKLRIRSRDGQFSKNFPVTTLTGDSFLQVTQSFNYNTYDVILVMVAPYKGDGDIDTTCRTWFKIHPTDGEAPTPAPVCPQDCKDILNKKYPPGPPPDYACLKTKCKQNCNECSVKCPFPKCINLATEELYCDIDECRQNCLGCGAAPKPSIPAPDIESLCKNATDLGFDDCIACLRGEGKYDGHPGIWTAIGCLPINYARFINEYVFTFGVGVAGGIAFLYFIYGCFLILTSMGNAEKIAQAKQIILSSISGVLFIIFSIFILKIIGVDILKIPGFG